MFVTRDYGRTFQSVAGDLPAYGNIQVVKEDPKNKDLLFVGTEFGLFTSLDGGKHWEKFMNDYPTVRTDDIFIHPRESDVIVATHGRSIFIADDISALEQWPSVGSADVYLFAPRPAVAWVNDITNNPHIGGQKNFIGENAPRGTAINYYLKSRGERREGLDRRRAGSNAVHVERRQGAQASTASSGRSSRPSSAGRRWRWWWWRWWRWRPRRTGWRPLTWAAPAAAAAVGAVAEAAAEATLRSNPVSTL